MNIDKQLDITIATTRIKHSECDDHRIPLMAEFELIEKVKQGKYKEIHLSDISKLDNGIGDLANDHTKQLEYIIVSISAVLCRASIDAGASPDDAFTLSDSILYLLSTLQTIDDINALYKTTAIRFAKLVHESRKQTPNHQIVQLQNYISSNIFHKITMSDLSDYVSLSPNYISRLFREEMGITIHNYIQKEKITVSCNLLQHTERSISDIASYMGFQTQSNFSLIFRKWMHMTPTEYRNKNYRDVY